MRPLGVGVLVGAALLLLAGIGVAFSFMHWPASTAGVLIGGAIMLTLAFSLAPGEKSWWMLPLLAAVALLSFAALAVFVWTVCWRR